MEAEDIPLDVITKYDKGYEMNKMVEMAAEIENLYFDEGMSFADIEKRTGLPYADIEAYINSVELHDHDEEPGVGFNSDAEADADTLASAGWGTDEDYGGCDERY